MLRGIIDEIERLHCAAAARRDEPRCAKLEEILARRLRELRAIAALEARDQGGRRPMLRVI
jgi:hypothetical protein